LGGAGCGSMGGEIYFQIGVHNNREKPQWAWENLIVGTSNFKGDLQDKKEGKESKQLRTERKP